MKTYAIILAAGMGSRMCSDVPKCAFKLIDKPMIEYIVDEIENEVDEIICVIGHKGNVIKEILNDRVKYVYQEKQLGTADAVLQALPFLLEGKSIIIPGDVPLINKNIINKIFENFNDYLTVVSTIKDNPTGYGRIVRDTSIIKIVEDKEVNEYERLIKEVNTGVICIDNNLLKKNIVKINNNNNKGEYYLTDIIELSNENEINSYLINDSNILSGVNDLYSLSIVEEYLRDKINKRHMLNGVNIINPKTVTISNDTIIERGVVIHQNCMITGKSIIKENCVVTTNSEIYNSILNENVICKNSVINESIINKNSSIGPFAHIRNNSIIGENNRIGNFVEVKNSITNNNTKSAHLSYLGDSEIGSNVNIGCGSITVNYDGIKKHKTIIGNNVFIGCNSNLIAPIEIDDNSFIAAGTTVTNKVESGDFVIGRVKQTNKKGYNIKK
ncbi:MAG: bifunctional UDP-N-acetylglucosamine diphosphorylase/glucosamine-1-phosphate N-acetyltransferase GlmU [bacterium]